MSLMENLQNEDLTAVAVEIADCIANDQAIAEYCMNHFGKGLTIFVGPPEAALPTIDDAPLVFVSDVNKNEGLKNTAEYSAVVEVGLNVLEKNAMNDSGVIVLVGHQRTSELLTLIQDALNRYHCHPPTEVEQYLPGLLGENPNFWQGFMSVTWQLDLPLGRKIKF